MNVIRIGEREGSGSPGQRRNRQLLLTARDMTLDRLKLALKTMLDKADDALFEFAQRSENAAHQLYFDAMREVRIKRARIEDEFKARFIAAFDERCLPAAAGRQAATPDVAAVSLTLVDTESVEEDVAVANMVEKIGNTCRDEVFALTKRVGMLLEAPDLDTGGNPLGPKPVCEAIRHACSTLDSGVKIRIILLKLFDRYVIAELGAIYHAVNQFFVAQQVLPEIRTGIRKPPVQAPRALPAGRAVPANGAAADGESLVAMLQQLVGQAGSAAPTAHPIAAVAVQGAIDTLNQLQHAGDLGLTMLGVDPMAMGAGSARANVLRGIKTSGVMPAVGKAGDMTIDIVAMLFDYILDDRNLADAVRALIGRLQIPILKVALLDREFFAKKSHPARLLLNVLAETAVRASGDPSLQEGSYKAIADAVNTVLNEFQSDIALFARVLGEFEQAVTAIRSEARVRSERTARVIQGRSRLEEAKEAARDAVEARLRDADVPEPVRNFLLSHWKRLLITAYVKEGRDGAGLSDHLRTMDDLIWSVGARSDGGERRRLGQMLPDLLARLKAGMDTLAVPALARSAFLGKLARIHGDRVRGEGSAQVAAATPPLALQTPPAAVLEATLPPVPVAAAAHADADRLADTVPEPGPQSGPQATTEFVAAAAPLDLDLAPVAAGGAEESTPVPETSAVAEGVQPEATASLNIGDADAFMSMFTGAGGEDLARLAAIGVEVEEVTIGDTDGGTVADLDDEHARAVCALQPGTWIEFRSEDGVHAQRARLTWINAATDTYLFTDRNGHKIADRTRNGLIAEFRRGSAQIVQEAPLLDRAFSRLLEGLVGTRRDQV